MRSTISISGDRIASALSEAVKLENEGKKYALGLKPSIKVFAFDTRKVSIRQKQHLARFLTEVRKNNSVDGKKLSLLQKWGITAIKPNHVICMLRPIASCFKGYDSEGVIKSSTEKTQIAKPSSNPMPQTMSDFFDKLRSSSEGNEDKKISRRDFQNLESLTEEELGQQELLAGGRNYGGIFDTHGGPRYGNILRVKEHALKSPIQQSDGKVTLMNASKLKFTSGGNENRVIIGMQHPLPTSDDLKEMTPPSPGRQPYRTNEHAKNETFQMLWDNDISKVSNLTNEEGDMSNTKGGGGPSFKYWPKIEGEVFDAGKVRVTNKGIKNKGSSSIINLELKDKKSGETKIVTMHHFKSWPDHDIPHGSAVDDYMSYLDGYRSQDRVSPEVVHCHAGVGRTGVHIIAGLAFDSVDRNPEQTEETLERYIQTLLWEVRSTGQKNMVQTVDQYNFTMNIAMKYLRAKKGKTTTKAETQLPTLDNKESPPIARKKGDASSNAYGLDLVGGEAPPAPHYKKKASDSEHVLPPIDEAPAPPLPPRKKK